MKNILISIIIVLYTAGAFSQPVDSGWKDCYSGTYTFKDTYGHVSKIILDYSLKLEYHGHCYESKATQETKYIGEFVTNGQWGIPDSNTVNILIGEADKGKSDKDAIYYCYHSQNSGYRAPINMSKGELIYLGNTYKRIGGPCTRVNNNPTNKEGLQEPGYVDPNAQIKSATIDLMNQWAQNSDDERVKQISENLNNVQESIDMFQRIDPENAEAFDQIESFAMGIGIIAGMFKKEADDNPGKQYWINGKLVELTDQEVADRGIKILISPYTTLGLIKIKEKIEEKIGLNDFFEKRIELFRQLISDVNGVNEDEIRLLKSKIYLAHIQNNEQARELAWVDLLNAFTSVETVRIFAELEKLNNEIIKLIIIEREVVKEVLLEGYYAINKSSWTKEEIINFNAQGKGDLSDEWVFSESPEIFIQTRNRLFPSSFWASQGPDLLKLTKYISPSTNQSLLTQADFLPINIFYGSLASYNNKAFNSFVMEAIKLRSPVSLNKFKYSASPWANVVRSANVNLIEEQHFQPIVYFKLFKPSKYNSDVMLGSEDDESKKEYLSSLKIEINTVRTSLADYHKRINKLSGKPISELKFAKVRQASNFEYKYILNIDRFFWYEIANYDINSFNLTRGSLEQINILIDYFETKIDDQTTIGDNIVKWNVYSDWEGAFMMKPHIRLYLFRYYIEMQSGITTHIESDKEFILENLYYVLEDFIRTEGNMAVAKKVLDDMGIK